MKCDRTVTQSLSDLRSNLLVEILNCWYVFVNIYGTLLFQQKTHLCLRRCQNKDRILILTWNKRERHNFKNNCAATPMLCCGRSGATCCHMKCGAIKNTTFQPRNVDLPVAPSQQVVPRSPVRTAQFALRNAKSATSLSHSRRRWRRRRRRRAVQCSAVPGIIVGATFIVT